MNPLVIRPIALSDNRALADIIRAVMTEFGASGPGFAIHDPEVQAMYESYSGPRAAYLVIVDGDRVVGGAGIAPLAGAEEGVCELRKMYFLPQARGRGAGRELLRRCLADAQARDYRTCYLETLQSMKGARALYESEGFIRIGKPLGNTGHFGCDAWYVKAL